MKRLLLVLSVCLLAATPAFADVTVTMTVSINAGPVAGSGTVVTQVKGKKVRTDAKIMGQDITFLTDAATRQQLMLNNLTKEASTFDLEQMVAGLPFGFGEPTSSVKPLGQSKTILGRACQGFTVDVSVPMKVNGESVTMKMTGPVWVTKEGAGVAEFQAASKALADAGIMASPLAQGPQAKGMMEVSKALAGAGVALEQELHVTMEGTGEMAKMLAQMGMSMTMTVTATAITTDPIPDAAFKVPEGYTKK